MRLRTRISEPQSFMKPQRDIIEQQRNAIAKGIMTRRFDGQRRRISNATMRLALPSWLTSYPLAIIPNTEYGILMPQCGCSLVKC